MIPTSNASNSTQPGTRRLMSPPLRARRSFPSPNQTRKGLACRARCRSVPSHPMTATRQVPARQFAARPAARPGNDQTPSHPEDRQSSEALSQELPQGQPHRGQSGACDFSSAEQFDGQHLDAGWSPPGDAGHNRHAAHAINVTSVTFSAVRPALNFGNRARDALRTLQSAALAGPDLAKPYQSILHRRERQCWLDAAAARHQGQPALPYAATALSIEDQCLVRQDPDPTACRAASAVRASPMA